MITHLFKAAQHIAAAQQIPFCAHDCAQGAFAPSGWKGQDRIG